MFIARETKEPKLGRSGMESHQKHTRRSYEAVAAVAASCYERAAARALARQSPGQSQRERVAR
jgi:hypothetical protein